MVLLNTMVFETNMDLKIMEESFPLESTLWAPSEVKPIRILNPKAGTLDA